MRNKILVSVFDTEPAAFEGLGALKDLHREGDITVYATSVIAKDLSGTVAVRQTTYKGPLGTLPRAVTGGLVFLTPGKAAVIAYVDETWITPVNSRLRPLGATTSRRLPGEDIDDQLTRESIAAEQELRELQSELRECSDEAKAQLRKSIEVQQHKLEATADRIQKAIAEADAEFEARLVTLHKQRARAHARQQALIAARIDELKASHELHKAKLEGARRLAIKSVRATGKAFVA